MNEIERVAFIRWLDGQIRDNNALVNQMETAAVPKMLVDRYRAETAAMGIVRSRLVTTEIMDMTDD